MHHPLAVTCVVLSVPIILGLCRAIGPGRAAPYAILGAFLILSRTNPDDKVYGIFTFDKLTVAGFSLTLGVLLFDRKTLARFRPSWVDVPMLLYIAAPLIGHLLGKSSDLWGDLDQSWLTFAEWGVPYALGRLYFADHDGPRRLAIAVVVAGLCYAPFCVYEMVMGKGWFLRSLIFGLTTDGEYRLGGWRPVVMMSFGLELVSWMSLATVLATWLWACRERWRMRYLSSWLPPLVLLLTTIACRGIYGYVILVVGLSAIGLILLTRSRWVLVPFLLAPVIYVGLRSTGLWDARSMVSLVSLLGEREASSVGLRLTMEDTFIRESMEHGLAFGLGGRYADSWADGWWLTLLKRGGLFAVASHYAAFLLPSVLFLFRRSTRPVIASAAAGLALFVILHMIDSLHNTSLIAVSTLLGGSLAGRFLAGSGHSRDSRSGEVPRSRASSVGSGHATYRVGDIGTPTNSGRRVDVLEPVGFMLAVACLLYVFGHAKVDGQAGAKIVGGLGSDLLYASAGALAAGSSRRSLARVAAFGLAFSLLGITSNLALHPYSRPVWLANILQGMALSGVIVACWRRTIGGGPAAYSALVLVASAWWAFEKFAPVFPGSQYLYSTAGNGLSLYPTLPWLTLAALGAVLVDASMTVRAALALVLGLGAVLSWGEGPPFGPPVKFPPNLTHALLGGSLVSAVFCLSGSARRWRPIAQASSWIGARWLVFFYIHLGLVPVLLKAGLKQPIACWSVLLVLSLLITWLVSWAFERVRALFLWPATWAIIFAATLVVGLLPIVPYAAVVVIANGCGLAFASQYQVLADLMLGPILAEDKPQGSAMSQDSPSRYFARLALIVVILVAPEVFRRLPAPFGIAPVVQAGSAARSAAQVEEH